MQDAVAKDKIEAAKSSKVVGEQVQFFEAEVGKRMGFSRVLEEFVADVNGDHFEPRPDRHMRRRGA